MKTHDEVQRAFKGALSFEILQILKSVDAEFDFKDVMDGIDSADSHLKSLFKIYRFDHVDQEKQALKERICHEATVDSIIWDVLQIDRMSNQEFYQIQYMHHRSIILKQQHELR